MQNCKGRTRTGAACRAPAGAGGLCFFHANPDRVKRLGQIGGSKNRRSAVDVDIPDNPSSADICKATAQAMRQLLGGELGAREASAFAQLANSLHRTITAADLETRITMLERHTEEGRTQREGGIAPDSDSIGSPTDHIETAETDLAAEQQTQHEEETEEP